MGSGYMRSGACEPEGTVDDGMVWEASNWKGQEKTGLDSWQTQSWLQHLSIYNLTG